MVSELEMSIPKTPNRRRVIQLVRRICDIAGSPTLIENARVSMARPGVIAAIRRRDTPAIFDWLVEALSYQGVSHSIAFRYMEHHGRVRWRFQHGVPSCDQICSVV
jgi:hypothetical protein